MNFPVYGSFPKWENSPLQEKVAVEVMIASRVSGHKTRDTRTHGMQRGSSGQA
jgi:hypothetical protein